MAQRSRHAHTTRFTTGITTSPTTSPARCSELRETALHRGGGALVLFWLDVAVEVEREPHIRMPEDGLGLCWLLCPSVSAWLRYDGESPKKREGMGNVASAGLLREYYRNAA